jgi:hypothetical protein
MNAAPPPPPLSNFLHDCIIRLYELVVSVRSISTLQIQEVSAHGGRLG